jgi:DNA-binding NtrC family response regulator
MLLSGPRRDAKIQLRVSLAQQAYFDVFLAGGGPWVLGSSLDNEVPIRARGVSRRHVELAMEEGRLRFKDLGSTNGTFLNEERASEGMFREGAVLRLGDVVLRVLDSATASLSPAALAEGLRAVSLTSLGPASSPATPAAGNHRQFTMDDVAALVGSFLSEGRTGQEWAMLSRFIRETLSCDSVRCYEQVEEGFALMGGAGLFPAESVSVDMAQQLASLRVMGTFRMEGEEGGRLLLALPVVVGEKRVCFIGTAPEGPDPFLQHQEILPVLYVLCRLVLRWADELRQRDNQVGELKERIRGIEANLAAGIDAAEPIVGRDPALLREIEAASRVAPTEMPVLLVGPTGSGKELFARRIHRLSNRSGAAFVPINCASIPETLLESELFGVERGAFTGADRSRMGLFEKAHRGTLFLDEVADLPSALQPKLLRVLEEKEVAPLGSTKARHVDVRLIAATNQNPSRLIAAGRFREDLYFRLAHVVVQIPPLRERGEDILLLANHFLHVANREFGKSVRGFEEEAVTELGRYGWPGNVRQLQALVKQMVLLSRDPLITADQVRVAVSRYAPGERPAAPGHWQLPWSDAYGEFEAEYFRRRLESHEGSVSGLARELGMTRPSLYLKMKKLGIKHGQEER